MVTNQGERPEVLSIGAVFGGTPEIDERWRPEVLQLMNEVIASRSEAHSPLGVNVVFHVDGDCFRRWNTKEFGRERSAVRRWNAWSRQRFPGVRWLIGEAPC